jgi:hypothetical protein
MTDAIKPFHNTTTQSERRETLENDQRVQRDTLQFRTSADLGLENTGRYAKPFAVTGQTPTPQYPAGPNWAPDPVGVEPPLGIDVNAMEPVGEVGEVQASIDRLEAAAPAEVSVPRSPDAVAESAAGTVQPLGPEDAARQVSFMSDRGAVPNQFKPQRRKPR